MKKINKTELYIGLYELALKRGFDKVTAGAHAMELVLNGIPPNGTGKSLVLSGRDLSTLKKKK
jgi:hypothetical protein